MAHYLHVELASTFELKFRILATPVAELWLERMAHREPYPLDHPDRFYGFDSRDIEVKRATTQIQQCIDTINDYKKIIDRPFTDIHDQDCLNYLHNIFERYHGLLDQQTHEYWQQSPDSVRRALAELNLAVHRCETVARGTRPRFVCTWFGMPKTQQLDVGMMEKYGELKINFGTVYLNYCEIGKTVEDLAHDNDLYIGDDAFRPFGHYSADFNVALYDRDLHKKIPSMQKYIEQHQEFFLAHGIENVYNVKAQPLRFPVADLDHAGTQEELIAQIRSRQLVREVTIQ